MMTSSSAAVLDFEFNPCDHLSTDDLGAICARLREEIAEMEGVISAAFVVTTAFRTKNETALVVTTAFRTKNETALVDSLRQLSETLCEFERKRQ